MYLFLKWMSRFAYFPYGSGKWWFFQRYALGFGSYCLNVVLLLLTIRERNDYDCAHEHERCGRGYRSPVLVLSEAVLVIVIEEGRQRDFTHGWV